MRTAGEILVYVPGASPQPCGAWASAVTLWSACRPLQTNNCSVHASPTQKVPGGILAVILTCMQSKVVTTFTVAFAAECGARR